MRNYLTTRGRIKVPFGRVMVAKTTHLGDLVISLPLAAAIKRHDPNCTVIYLTNRSTVDVARHCSDIDEVYAEPDSPKDLLALLVKLDIDIFVQVNCARSVAKAAALAAIPVRIGSTYRLYNFLFCTELVPISRLSAGLNKRQLDLQYLRPLGIEAGLTANSEMPPRRSPSLLVAKAALIHPRQFAGRTFMIILSPSLITARAHQWPLEAFSSLIRRLDPDQFHWFICGVSGERNRLLPLLSAHLHDSNVTDMVGKLSLNEFISFTSECDGLIAGSTGPLHLAAALGINALGLFASNDAEIRRWRPIGPKASVIYSSVNCKLPKPLYDASDACPCIVAIDPASVAARVQSWFP